LSANHAAFTRLAARQRHLAGPPVTGLTTWREFGVEGEGDRFAAFAAALEVLEAAAGAFDWAAEPDGSRVLESQRERT